MSDTKTTIIEIARTICLPNVPNLDDADRALFDSGLDSLDYASLLMALEDKFGIQFTNDELEDMNTINKITSAIEKQTGN